METIETIQYRGQEIEIFQDDYPTSPDEYGNDDIFLVYGHRDFEVKVKGYDPEEIFHYTNERKRLFYEGYWVFPVFAYIHSEVSLSLDRRGGNMYWQHVDWDVSFQGFALVKKMKGWTYTRKQAEKIAQSLLDEWNDYLSGNVYGYKVLNDSCSGYYGDPEKSGCIDLAKGHIDSHIEKERAKWYNTLKSEIKGHRPLNYRLQAPVIIYC